MTGEVEAAGDAITGGLIARAVEGGVHGHGAHSGVCLNCGTKLIGAHCHACGQAGHIHRSLSAIWHDIAHGVLHFEGKIWRTLPLLIFRPGELTRRYIHGERARFVSPLALFLFSVFLMFAILSIFGSHLAVPQTDARASEQAITELRSGKSELTTELEKLDAQIERARAAGEDTGPLRRERANTAGLLRFLEGGPSVLAGDATTRDAADASIAVKRDAAAAELKEVRAELEAARKAGRETAEIKARRDALRDRVERFDNAADMIDGHQSRPTILGFKTGWSRLDKGIKKANENPNLLLYKLQTNAYKFSWMLIPISVPFVWLLFFWHRKRHVYDHAVFVTYSLAFMTLFFTLLTLLGSAGVPSDTIEVAGFIVPPVHIYFQLKGAYEQTRGKALIRTFVLLNFALIAIALFAVLLVGLGLVG